ncbi:MAG: hypothetical protein WD673_17385 [Alphaproteobacteria bacterium]
MVGKKITALALAAALALSPTLAFAQEEATGGAAGQEGIATPFGEVSPLVAGIVVVGAIVGLAVGLSSNNNNNATGTGGTGGTGGTQ